MEYACAATNDQMYSVGEETEVVPNTFEEATITGSRWVYKINAEKIKNLSDNQGWCLRRWNARRHRGEAP